MHLFSVKSRAIRITHSNKVKTCFKNDFVRASSSPVTNKQTKFINLNAITTDVRFAYQTVLSATVLSQLSAATKKSSTNKPPPPPPYHQTNEHHPTSIPGTTRCSTSSSRRFTAMNSSLTRPRAYVCRPLSIIDYGDCVLLNLLCWCLSVILFALICVDSVPLGCLPMTVSCDKCRETPTMKTNSDINYRIGKRQKKRDHFRVTFDCRQ